jgi:hypothetical protein
LFTNDATTLMNKLLVYLFLIFYITSGGIEDREASYLREFRNIMLEEVNFLRTHHAEYAERRLRSIIEDGSDNGAYKYLKGVKPAGSLLFNKTLNSISMDYAELLAGKNKFSHTAKGTPFSRAKTAGYVYKAMAENIACGNDPQLNVYENPRSAAVEFVKMLVIDKNVKDLGHRHTLLNPIYKSVGFGFGYNPKSYCINYVVQDFGNP